MVALPSTSLLATPVAVKPPRQNGIPSVELDAQCEDLSCLGEEAAALDGTSGKRTSALLDRTVDEEVLSGFGRTSSLASFRTVSTELYVPPHHSKGNSLQDGRVSSIKDYIQNSRQRSPVQKLETSNRNKGGSARRPESTKKNPKKRKRSQTELAAADVDAAIRMVISAAEVIVVGHLIDPSSLWPGQDRSIILEAASSLGKARHLCGLDKYDLDATTKDFDELQAQELDHESMQEAYADVGMIIDVPGDERQLLCVGMAVDNLPQENVDVHARARCPRNCATEVVDSLQRIGGTRSDVCTEIAQDQIGSKTSECGGVQRSERTGDNVQVHSLKTEEVKEPAGKLQPLDWTSTIESRNPLNADGLLFEGKVKEPSLSCKSVAVLSADCELEMGDNITGDEAIIVGNNQQDTEVLEELDAAVIEGEAVSTTQVMQSQQNSEPRVVILSTRSYALEGGSSVVDGETVKTTSTVPTQIEQIICWPEENSDKAVPQVPNADLGMTERSPNNDMFCGGLLLQSGPMVERIQHTAEHQEEVEGEKAMGMEAGVTYNKVTHSSESSEHHIELCLPSEAMASSETKWSHPDVGNSPVILRVPSVENSTRKLVTPYVSRWFGGWSNSAVFNPTEAVATERRTDVERFTSTSLNDIGSEDAVPEQNALQARQKGLLVGQETTAFRSILLDQAVGGCFAQNDDVTPGKPENDSSVHKSSHSHALDVSQVESLCSFVPCSISASAAVSLLPCHGDHQSSLLPATVEAYARAAMNNIDSQKVAHCQTAGGAFELESVPDPAVRIDNEASRKQILETRIDPVSFGDVSVKRTPTLMKKLSTTTNSLSLLLHAVDLAGKSSPNVYTVTDGTRSPNFTSVSPLGLEEKQGEVEQSSNCDVQATVDLPDVTLTSTGKRVLTEKRMSTPDRWMGADLSNSPPLVWPRGKKRRLTCGVVDSDSTEWLHDNGNHHLVHKDLEREQHTSHNVTRQSGRLALRTETRSKPGQEAKTLFKGLQFLLTGFSSQNKDKLTKIVEQCGGELLADVPRFSPKQRFKRKGVDCGARNSPIVIAPQPMRTHKYLYGCAVGAPLLDPSWIYASVSALKHLPYLQYHSKHKRAGWMLQTSTGCVSKSCESPLFVGFKFLFHGQQDFISQLSTLAKHAGGKVIRKLALNESQRQQRQKLVGLVVVEGSKNLPLELRRVASRLEYQVVDSEWMIVSLLNGKLHPLSTNSTPPSYFVPSHQSSASRTGERPQRHSHRRIQLQCENSENREDEGSEIELSHRSLPDENRPSQSSVRAKSPGKESEEQGHINTCCLGKSSTSPVQVPQLTDRILGPYSHSLAHRKLPNKVLYYEGFLCNGVEYFLGDVVEVRAPIPDCPPFVARIEGLWCEENSRSLPRTRAVQQGLRKKVHKSVVLKCRRFYRPSETGFPGQQGSNTTDEIYLSNDINDDVSASDVVRRVRLKLETADEAVHCRNWRDGVVGDDQERAAGSLISHANGTPTASRAADYLCSFFYDHLGESLHRIKLEK